MYQKSQEEIERGCLKSSKIFPIANEVKARYLAGESMTSIGNSYRHLGVTSAAVSGFITKNKIKRLAQAA